ncbi:MAG: helix-turn-helix transcriptional regulator [Dehalococcoidaceae bacterium]|nr:helix-turn-helix transcriptional regulator [Dehalococcoidaceae bacterium]
MKTSNVLKEKTRRVCLVTDDSGFKKMQLEYHNPDFPIILKEHLLDLSTDYDCQLFIIDTRIKDMDKWPAPLVTLPDANRKSWIFLVSGLADTSFIHPFPRNAMLIDRMNLSSQKFESLIKKQLDPNSGKIFERVVYLKDTRSFLIWMENGKSYLLRVSDIPEADSSDILKWSLGPDMDFIQVVQQSGNIIEVPWDTVLYNCEPEYEFFEGKNSTPEISKESKIGQRIRQAREQKGYTVQELADRTGIKRPNLSRLEHGRHQPSLETLERIAEALNIPVFELLIK